MKEPITKKDLEDAIVNSPNNYNSDNELIGSCLNSIPKNTDANLVAMKILLIDAINSTNLSKNKNKISITELAKIIVDIPNIDTRIKDGDPKVVNEIAKCNGKVILFSFASKYCFYHNWCVYKSDDYSIYDTIIKDNLPRYFNITSSQLEKWRKDCEYEKFNDFITNELDKLKINIEGRKRKLDFYIWNKHRNK